MTDLGTYDENMIDKIKNLDVLLLEANHDVHMLQVGSYPYPLKQRILGEKDISLTNCPVSFGRSAPRPFQYGYFRTSQ